MSDAQSGCNDGVAKKLYLVKHDTTRGKWVRGDYFQDEVEITPDEVEKYLKELLDGYIEDYDNGDISKEDFLDSFPLTVKLRMLKKLDGFSAGFGAEGEKKCEAIE